MSLWLASGSRRTARFLKFLRRNRSMASGFCASRPEGRSVPAFAVPRSFPRRAACGDGHGVETVAGEPACLRPGCSVYHKPDRPIYLNPLPPSPFQLRCSTRMQWLLDNSPWIIATVGVVHVICFIALWRNRTRQARQLEAHPRNIVGTFSTHMD